MIIGYVTLASPGEDPSLQFQALAWAGASQVAVDQVANSSAPQPARDQLLSQLRERDVVAVTHLARLAPAGWAVLEVLGRIGEAGAHLVATDEGIDTRRPGGEQVFALAAAVRAVSAPRGRRGSRQAGPAPRSARSDADRGPG